MNIHEPFASRMDNWQDCQRADDKHTTFNKVILTFGRELIRDENCDVSLAIDTSPSALEHMCARPLLHTLDFIDDSASFKAAIGSDVVNYVAALPDVFVLICGKMLLQKFQKHPLFKKPLALSGLSHFQPSLQILNFDLQLCNARLILANSVRRAPTLLIDLAGSPCLRSVRHQLRLLPGLLQVKPRAPLSLYQLRKLSLHSSMLLNDLSESGDTELRTTKRT